MIWKLLDGHPHFQFAPCGLQFDNTSLARPECRIKEEDGVDVLQKQRFFSIAMQRFAILIIHRENLRSEASSAFFSFAPKEIRVDIELEVDLLDVDNLPTKQKYFFWLHPPGPGRFSCCRAVTHDYYNL